MSRRILLVTALIGLVTAACAADPSGTGPLSVAAGDGLPSCLDVPGVSAPEEAYRDEPLYVGIEMPVEEVQAWAASQPGYAGIWIDREHNGWVTVAFTEGADQRQNDIDEMFPEDGVVAVAVAHSIDDLYALQDRVATFLQDRVDSYGVGSYENKGVVGVDLGVLDPEVVTALEDEFPGEPICVDGPDPSDLPAPGPQPEFGEGWRLLADEAPAGEPYRTGIATDQGSLTSLWETIGLETTTPDVDFQTEVVIWFGAVYGSSCPDIRLDDVVVAGDVVHAVIVLVNPPMACTDDANPHAYVVALERSKLPLGPFVIQLDGDGPPSGVPEERTVVDVDLSEPGSVAGPGDVHGDPNLPEPSFVQSGDYIETGFPTTYRLDGHCGIEWLGELNDVIWRTDEVIPPEWEAVANEEVIEMEITMFPGNPPTVEAVANGITVVYLPDAGPIPGCD